MTNYNILILLGIIGIGSIGLYYYNQKNTIIIPDVIKEPIIELTKEPTIIPNTNSNFGYVGYISGAVSVVGGVGLVYQIRKQILYNRSRVAIAAHMNDPMIVMGRFSTI